MILLSAFGGGISILFGPFSPLALLSLAMLGSLWCSLIISGDATENNMPTARAATIHSQLSHPMGVAAGSYRQELGLNRCHLSHTALHSTLCRNDLFCPSSITIMEGLSSSGSCSGSSDNSRSLPSNPIKKPKLNQFHEKPNNSKYNPDHTYINKINQNISKRKSFKFSKSRDLTLNYFEFESLPKKKYKQFNQEENFTLPNAAMHYTCPPVSLQDLRRRYGSRRSLWGEWDSAQTRQFYKTQLPKALQIDGALGLSLEERAKLAAQARYFLRIYARERCHLPARLFTRIYDGFRHLLDFGSWSPDGMTWSEVKQKYSREARRVLGSQASQEQIDSFVYRRIVDKASSTNQLFDQLAEEGVVTLSRLQITEMLKTVFHSLLGRDEQQPLEESNTLPEESLRKHEGEELIASSTVPSSLRLDPHSASTVNEETVDVNHFTSSTASLYSSSSTVIATSKQTSRKSVLSLFFAVFPTISKKLQDYSSLVRLVERLLHFLQSLILTSTVSYFDPNLFCTDSLSSSSL